MNGGRAFRSHDRVHASADHDHLRRWPQPHMAQVLPCQKHGEDRFLNPPCICLKQSTATLPWSLYGWADGSGKAEPISSARGLRQGKASCVREWPQALQVSLYTTPEVQHHIDLYIQCIFSKLSLCKRLGGRDSPQHQHCIATTTKAQQFSNSRLSSFRLAPLLITHIYGNCF